MAILEQVLHGLQFKRIIFLLIGDDVMKKINVIFFAIVFLLTTARSPAQTDPKQERYDRLKQMEQAGERSINFYGKIKDQFGQPVAGAKVTVGIECFSLTAFYFMGIKDIVRTSDSNGIFTIQETGKSLTMRNIEKEGYLFKSADNPKQSFEYSNVKDSNYYMPDVNNPITFVLQKKPQPGVVIEKNYSCRKKIKGFDCRVNILSGIYDLNDITFGKKQTHFVFSVKPSEQQNEYKLEMKAGDNESGFIELNLEPHVAPETGYVPSVLIVLKTQEDIEKNIYFMYKKTPTQPAYARLVINLFIGEENIHLKSNLYTNVAGDRNLEYDAAYTEQQLKK